MTQPQNPYSAPVAELNQEPEQGDFIIHEPRAVGAGRGAAWMFEGFGYFKASPVQWILTCIVGFILMIVLNVIPVVNLVAGLLMFVWSGGIVLGCKAQYDGDPFTLKYLFAGFKNRTASLVGLGALALGITLVVMALALGSLFLPMITGNMEALGDVNPLTMLLGLLIALAVMLPLYMALWFAPCLIVLGNYGIVDALKASFMAGLKNILGFFIYGLVMMVLFILASIPVGLGLLVVMPMFFASIFVSFKEIFVD